MSVDTVNGIPITRNGPVEGAPPAAATAETVFRMGGADAPSEYLFASQLISIERRGQDGFYVLDFEAGDVRAFDHSGRFIRRFGRPGRGPGELLAPGGLTVDSLDRLWVANSFDGRYTVFDSAGGFVRTAERPIHSVSTLPFPLHFDASGAAIIDHVGDAAGLQLVRVDTAGIMTDSFPPIDRPPSPARLRGILLSNRPALAEATCALRPAIRWALTPEATVWFARSDSLRLIHRSLDGDTLRIIEASHRDRGWTDAESELLDRAEAEAGTPLDYAPPIVQQLLPLPDGRVLVQVAGELGAPGHVLDVFGPEGEYLGEIVVEFPLHPRAIPAADRESIIGVSLGGLDVPYVVRVDLRWAR